MIPEFPAWPYVPTLARLSLAMAIGLLIGIERERRQVGLGQPAERVPPDSSVTALMRLGR